jgi:antitoxin ParD1/3/4
MPKAKRISVGLPFRLANDVRQAVESGEYASSRAIVHEALTEWAKKQAQREAVLRKIPRRSRRP